MKNSMMKILDTAKRVLLSVFFNDSSQYWEKRYSKGGDSGIGSYGNFAEFKAKEINNFIRTNNIKSSIEFGCGDGHQLSLINYECYLGLDVSQAAINICREKYRHDNTKSFSLLSEYNNTIAELSLSLDVLYHLTEDSVYHNYLRTLFASSDKFVIIYSTNFDSKKTFNFINKHVRHRKFTEWVTIHQPEWQCISHTPGPFPLGSGNSRYTIDFFIYCKKS